MRNSTLAAAAVLTFIPAAQSQRSVSVHGTLDVHIAQQVGTGISSRKVAHGGYNPINLGFSERERLDVKLFGRRAHPPNRPRLLGLLRLPAEKAHPAVCSLRTRVAAAWPGGRKSTTSRI